MNSLHFSQSPSYKDLSRLYILKRELRRNITIERRISNVDAVLYRQI
jgi:hypothetical protein